MIDISNDMRASFEELNEALKKKKKEQPEREYLRKFIQGKLGILSHIEPMEDEYLEQIQKTGGLCAVDGSVNRVGGAAPHYVDFFKGLAKSTIGGEVSLADFYSPLIDREYSEEDDYSKRDKMLAEIEIKTAILAIEKLKPKFLMMDGSLLRYRIFNESMWEELKEKALENNVIFIGVIKDIKTSFIGSELGISSYDKELLYGTFEIGEFFSINPDINKSKKSNLSSGFLRGSLDPNVCGIDIIEEEEEFLIDSARLVFSLTPKNSRGIPLFLDIVDKEVKITDAVLKGCMENFLDRDLYETFIVSERQKRNL